MIASSRDARFYSSRSVYLAALVCFVVIFGWIGSAAAQSANEQATEEQRAAAETQAAVERVSDMLNAKTTYDLRYRLTPGQSLSWKVEHVTSTKTQISGTTEEASGRIETLSTWNVTDVNKTSGEVVVENSIEAIKSWKKIGEEDPVVYDSRTSKKIPDEYGELAETLGQRRSRVTFQPNGKVVDRQSEYASTAFSTGDLTVPLPGKPVTVGYRWNIPMVFQSSNEHGAHVNLKARRCYELLKVKKGKAYISFRTEVLTPIKSHTVRSKILQKLIKGYIVWDIARGLPIQRRTNWNEKVQAYNGADSFLKYVGRMTVKLVDATALAEVTEAKRALTFTALKPLKVAPVKLRLRNQPPEMRR